MDTVLATKPVVHAIVAGKALTEVPNDLFIPPDALEVLLDSFSGPLDLLLYLIRKQNVDILDIPIMSITQQYLQYIQLMEYSRHDLAAEYLLMAAMLAEIKARLLLPVSSQAEDEEEDPRMALVRQLQAYEQIKLATELLDALPREERDTFPISVFPDTLETIKVHPEVALTDLIEVMNALMQKEEHFSDHQVVKELMSVRERMSYVLLQLQEHKFLEFKQLIIFAEGRRGVVLTLLAILELARQYLLVITQPQAFSAIHLQVA